MGKESIMSSFHWEPFAIFGKSSGGSIEVYLGEKENISEYHIKSFIRDEITIRQMFIGSEGNIEEPKVQKKHKPFPRSLIEKAKRKFSH
jgi:hypothetical protein